MIFHSYVGLPEGTVLKYSLLLDSLDPEMKGHLSQTSGVGPGAIGKSEDCMTELTEWDAMNFIK